jgi:pSer/pThr/pTyr-binding forkhead associated (FHA) protein
MTGADPQSVKTTRIGRRPGNGLVVCELGVSKQHAELRLSPAGRYSIIDLGSHNGTYVNGTRVDQAELTDGDTIGIGHHATFRFSGGELRPYAGEGPGSGDDSGVPDVTVALSPDEALVLFELLHRWEDPGEIGTVLMPGERTALRALSGLLESILVEPLEASYRELVDNARQRLVERGGA